MVALDFDHATVDGALPARCGPTDDERILPLVGNLVDPSPGLGWRGAERRPLERRGDPDLILALALVHHLSITGNVPLAELLDWFASLGAPLVIEFPTREDPMVERLLAAKAEGLHADYELGEFERLLGERFEVERREELPSGSQGDVRGPTLGMIPAQPDRKPPSASPGGAVGVRDRHAAAGRAERVGVLPGAPLGGPRGHRLDRGTGPVRGAGGTAGNRGARRARFGAGPRRAAPGDRRGLFAFLFVQMVGAFGIREPKWVVTVSLLLAAVAIFAYARTTFVPDP